ncbi:MAG: NADH-quinone oxidoreductase subunit C [Deltaproteobacteria bacterium]|nr:NADH-quinone oxidoreductase subunit C [Deltaproteobacteria bacterium]
MNAAEIHARLSELLGARAGTLSAANKDEAALIAPRDLLEVCRALKTDDALAFDALMNLGCVDWPGKSEIELVLHLFSYARRHGFVLKCRLDRAQPRVASVVPIWSSAEWLEREQFDLFGVVFEGNPDLRRLLMPDDWIGFPLRKDYEEPESWHGISTVRESPLDGFVRLDELKKKLAASRAETVKAADAPKPDGAP